MLLPDIFVQIFSVWLSLQLILKSSFDFTPHPLKTLALSAITVLGVNIGRRAVNLGMVSGDLDDQIEKFIVDLGVEGECKGESSGGLQRGCDIWSDPEKIIDQRVERVLERIKHESRAIEDFLRVDLPNKRERTAASKNEGLIV